MKVLVFLLSMLLFGLVATAPSYASDSGPPGISQASSFITSATATADFPEMSVWVLTAESYNFIAIDASFENASLDQTNENFIYYPSVSGIVSYPLKTYVADMMNLTPTYENLAASKTYLWRNSSSQWRQPRDGLRAMETSCFCNYI